MGINNLAVKGAYMNIHKFHPQPAAAQCRVTLNMLNKYKSIGGSMYQIFGGLAPPFQA